LVYFGAIIQQAGAQIEGSVGESLYVNNSQQADSIK